MGKLLLAVIATAALILGALFAFPVYKKEFVRVELGGTSVLAEVARDPRARGAGLAGRESLAETEGMLFVFEKAGSYGIWMKGMLFPLDIFWIKDGIVVDIEAEVPAPVVAEADSLRPVYRPDAPAQFVLETKAGFAGKHNIKIGDPIKIFFSDNASTVKNDEPEPPGYEYYIETLRLRGFKGSDFRVKERLAQADQYQKFLISYKSGGLTVSGVMNVPSGPRPEGGYPLLILNHGLIPPEIYFSGRGSKREQDFFARNGYITIHPDYRGYASSSANPVKNHDFYVGYTEDVINLIEALRELNSSLMDLNRIGMWGHSLGGGMATRVMVLRPEIKAFVLFAPISAEVKDNFFELSSPEVARLEKTYGSGAEADEIYRQISPLAYFDKVAAPVQIHHGTEDKDVPIAFSEKIYQALKDNGQKVEFYRYPGEPHEFVNAWELAAERSLQFFDRYVKNAR